MDGRVTRVAIVGTAGRGADGCKMTPRLYTSMVNTAQRIISNRFGLQTQQVVLVSGGAAWADHVAVKLWLEHLGDFHGLRLHLPCAFVHDSDSPHAYDSGINDWQTNPGRTMNLLHKRFSQTIRSNSLMDLHVVAALGAELDSSVHGFHARNTVVAQSEYLIAFTWGVSAAVPKDGGTLDTWNKCRGTRVHIPLDTLQTESEQTPEHFS